MQRGREPQRFPGSGGLSPCRQRCGRYRVDIPAVVTSSCPNTRLPAAARSSVQAAKPAWDSGSACQLLSELQVALSLHLAGANPACFRTAHKLPSHLWTAVQTRSWEQWRKEKQMGSGSLHCVLSGRATQEKSLLLLPCKRPVPLVQKA